MHSAVHYSACSCVFTCYMLWWFSLLETAFVCSVSHVCYIQTDRAGLKKEGNRKYIMTIPLVWMEQVVSGSEEQTFSRKCWSQNALIANVTQNTTTTATKLHTFVCKIQPWWISDWCASFILFTSDFFCNTLSLIKEFLQKTQWFMLYILSFSSALGYNTTLILSVSLL